MTYSEDFFTYVYKEEVSLGQRSCETTDYDDTVRDVEKTLGIFPGFMKALPQEALVNEWPLFKKYTLGQSQIPPKYRELMGLAIAANLKCPYCEFFHTATSRMNGATEDELAEVYFLSSLTSRWSAMIHAQHYDMGVFEKETAQIGEYLQRVMAQKITP